MERRRQKQLLAGNVATLAITLLAFLQLLPWPIAGYLTIVSIVIVTVSYLNPSSRWTHTFPESPVSTPVIPAREGPSEKPQGRVETQAVAQSPKSEQRRPVSTSTSTADLSEAQPEAGEVPTVIEDGDYLSSLVELGKGEEVVGEVLANGDVNVYVLTEDNLSNLDMGQEFWYEAGIEGVRDGTLHFEAPENGKWFFVVENADTRNVSATVRISVDKTSRSVPLLKTENLGLPDQKLGGKL